VAVIVAISFAGQTITLSRYRSFDMMPAVCIGGFLAFVTGGFIRGLVVPLENIAVLALMGVLQLAIPLILFARGARYVPATTLSLTALLDAVLNPLWSWAGGGERPTLEAISGGVIILGAVSLSILVARPAQPGEKTADSLAAGRHPTKIAPGQN
jgi:drug/metabolite transporter (DMT)-like permease